MRKADYFLDRHWLAVMVAFSVLYLFCATTFAANRAFWHDELWTYYLGNLSTSEIIQMLHDRIEHIPFPYFVLTGWAMEIPADVHLTMRLPNIFGVLFASLAVMVFVTRRSSIVFGLLAAFLLLMTLAWEYAYEGRPYGISLGFFAISLLGWQLAADADRGIVPTGYRWLGIAMLAGGIAAGISMNYFAVLAVVPLAIAELVRMFERRRIDLPMIAGFLLGGSVCLIYLPFVTNSVSGFGKVNSHMVRLPDFYDAFQYMLSAVGGVLMVCLAIALLTNHRRQPMATNEQIAETKRIPFSERAVLLAILTLPLIAEIVGYLFTNKFAERYVLGTVLSFAIIPAIVLARFVNFRIREGLIMVCVAAGAFIVMQYARTAQHFTFETPVSFQAAGLKALVEGQEELPIVIDSPEMFLTTSHYLPEMRDRIWYLMDERAIEESISNYSGMGWDRLKRLFPVQAARRSEFVEQHERFYFITSNSADRYLRRILLRDNLVLQLVGVTPGELPHHDREMFLVSHPVGQTESEVSRVQAQ